MAYYEGHVGDRPSSRAGEPDQLRRLSAAVRACTDGDPADETGQGGGGGLGAYLGATAALNAAESCGYDAYHSATNTHRGAAGGRSRPLSPSQMRREEHRIDGGRRDMAVSVEGGTADEVRRGLGALRRALSGDDEEEGSAELGRRGGRGIGGAPVRVSSLRGKRSLLAPAADRASTPTSLAGEYTLEEAMELEIYYVKQRRGYFSLAFSAVQGAVLLIMMLQCGVAPLTVNPMVGPYPDALNYWGAKNAVLIIDEGESWRLLTPIFLHAGLVHLAGNVAVQLETGAFFEREWGSPRWLAVYLGSAIGSSALSCIFMPGQISVGSSGSVCGLFGAKLTEILLRSWESRKTAAGRVGHEVRREQLAGVLCSVALVGMFSFIPYVDWAAHLGGFLAGLVIGLVAFSFSIKTKVFVALWLAVGLAATAAFFGAVLGYMYSNVDPDNDLRDVCEYYRQFFPDYECNCQLDN